MDPAGDLVQERRRLSADERRRRLAEAVPGSGPIAWFDRAAWTALSQEDPAFWSWPRALATIAAAMALAVVIYLTIYREPTFVVGLCLAYLVLLLRARLVHARYVKSRA